MRDKYGETWTGNVVAWVVIVPVVVCLVTFLVAGALWIL